MSRSLTGATHWFERRCGGRVPCTPRPPLDRGAVADSSLALDRRLKLGLYARAGLPEFWIANLVEGVLEVHREPRSEPEAAYGWVYRSVEILRPPAAVIPLGAPGSLIPVADLLP